MLHLEGLEPVADEEGNEGGDEGERELHDELGPEVGDRAVGPVGVLAHEQGALAGEQEDHRLRWRRAVG